MGLFSSIAQPFLHTMEDFMGQSLVMKAIIAWGWLAIIIMIASLGASVRALVAL